MREGCALPLSYAPALKLQESCVSAVLNDPGESIFESKLESTMRTVQVKVKGLQLVNGIWRSRKVLPPEVAAIVGKSELTRTTGVAGEKDDIVALAKARDVAVREDHQGEFKRIIAEAREEANSPYNRLLKADPNVRHLDMEEISERAAELGICDDLFVAHVPKSPFEKLLDAEPSLRKAELHEITARLHRAWAFQRRQRAGAVRGATCRLGAREHQQADAPHQAPLYGPLCRTSRPR